MEADGSKAATSRLEKKLDGVEQAGPQSFAEAAIKTREEEMASKAGLVEHQNVKAPGPRMIEAREVCRGRM